MKVVSKHNVMTATQWNKHGDHPEVKKVTNPDFIRWFHPEIEENPDKYGQINYVSGRMIVMIVRSGEYIIENKMGIQDVISEEDFNKTYIKVKDYTNETHQNI